MRFGCALLLRAVQADTSQQYTGTIKCKGYTHPSLLFREESGLGLRDLGQLPENHLRSVGQRQGATLLRAPSAELGTPARIKITKTECRLHTNTQCANRTNAVFKDSLYSA